ncbi:MAG: DNA-binding protein [Balneola sp.]|jgi:transcriptional regulator with XRE-family HTH domain|nr:DNA-binding protein [Balneola sp.]MAL19045.1 DNA-binding protein [Balneola sp.]MBE80133.1 DNA-binding protein [Balneola sp.]|tara:strand:- start:9029 stop:9637 length:609 start_codon:yes stop_codon:yes gene_type:complete
MSTDLANQIKNIRNQKGFSQELLAEKTELSLRTIQRVENAETEPRGDTLLRITEALEVTPDQLLEWNQVEDQSTLVVMSLSALGFLFTPILGVILPLVIWISRKDRVKKADMIGRKVINFQLTFTALIYLMQGLLFMIPILQLDIGFWLEGLFDYLNISPILFQPIIFGIPYLYNLGSIIINTFRIRAGDEVSFSPSVKLLK